jgi:hypothetical protein
MCGRRCGKGGDNSGGAQGYSTGGGGNGRPV